MDEDGGGGRSIGMGLSLKGGSRRYGPGNTSYVEVWIGEKVKIFYK